MKQNLLKKGIKCIRDKRYNFLIFGIIYFFISIKNGFIENLKYWVISLFNKNYQVKVNNSLMHIDFKDKGISKELCIHKKREFFATDFMKTFIKKNDIIIDIGANKGYYALLEASLVKKGKVYAVEPIPENIESIKKNIKLNGYKNISVFQCAIGDYTGTGTMNVYNKSNWCSFTENPNIKITKTINVPLSTLDNFAKRNSITPSMIIMDVEGYECQIIEGMKKILENKKPLKIVMELHPYWLGLMTKKNMHKLIEILEKNKFKIKAIFLEINPINYKNIKFINKLRVKLGLPKYGFVGNSYNTLRNLLKFEDTYTPQIFFERN